MSAAECVESAAYWDLLAIEALRLAKWHDTHTGSGAAQRHKAESYKCVSQALRIEAETGAPHCACCLKPMGRPSGPGVISTNSCLKSGLKHER